MPTPTKTEESPFTSLDEALNREVILMGGGPGDGKTYSVAKIIEECEETGHQVVVIDRDRGLAKVVYDVMGRTPDCLHYAICDKWEKVNQAVDFAFKNLGPGDWLVFEMIGAMWDFAQTEYSRKVYGDLTEHMLNLRAEAQQVIRNAGLDPKSKDARKKVAEKVGFGGLDGRQDWSFIKRMHNDDVFIKAIVEGDFNILSTTSMTPVAKDEAEKYPLWVTLGRRPTGEKEQPHRHDTLVVVEKKGNKYVWRTDLGAREGKDRGGRKLVRDVDFTDIGFWRSYRDYHNLESVPSKQEDSDDDEY